MLYYLSQDLTCARECPVPCQTGLSQDLLTCARAYFQTAVCQKDSAMKISMCNYFNQSQKSKLGSVAGSVIQANGRLSFEDELRSGGLFYCVSQCTKGHSLYQSRQCTVKNLSFWKKKVKKVEFGPGFERVINGLECESANHYTIALW